MHALTGLQPVESNYHRTSAPIERTSIKDDAVPGIFSPDNPLFWAGAILAASVGLVGVSGSVRLGKARASASVDKA